jgi:hypothetical protein
VFTTLIWPQAGYGAQLVYSVSIGLLIWAVIEFGRLLVPAEHCHRDPSRPGHGWPKGWRGVLLTVAGIGLGYLGGNRLAAALLGETVASPARDQAIGLAIAIVAGLVASFYFFTRGRQAALQASIAAAERDAAQARLMLLQASWSRTCCSTPWPTCALIGVEPRAPSTCSTGWTATCAPRWAPRARLRTRWPTSSTACATTWS